MPIIFGLDPSLRSTGYGIIQVEGRALRSLAYGVIKNADKVLPSRCLIAIHQQVSDLVRKYQPEAAAVEGIIYLQNYQTAITLGSARGAALLALAVALTHAQNTGVRRKPKEI
jgi:crossover junction endodeoxyribonuclease RuvC